MKPKLNTSYTLPTVAMNPKGFPTELAIDTDGAIHWRTYRCTYHVVDQHFLTRCTTETQWRLLLPQL